MNAEKRYVWREEAGLFDRFDRISQIDKMGDPLANLDAVMSWEIFQPVLESIPGDEPKGAGGRPPFHPMFMFKILVIQSLYGLHDEQTQFQILDRRSFARFLGITDADTVPDQNTNVNGFGTAITGTGGISRTTAATTSVAFNAFAATYDLSAPAYQGLSTITFRLALFDNLNENGKLTRFDDFTLNGTAAAIPDPSAALLCGLGLLALLRRRR